MTISFSDPNDYLIYFVIALVPNTIGWLIKYIFTGDGNFFLLINVYFWIKIYN